MSASVTGWRIKGDELPLDVPLIMGIVNVTPDSFSDGGRFAGAEAIEHGLSLAEAGADILDVGGESTRPGAEPVPVGEELDRVTRVVDGLAGAGHVVSIDTMKPEVASAAIAVGAAIVNDVSGLAEPRMRQVVAEAGTGVVIMHMQGEPRTMQIDPTYADVVADISQFLSDRIRLAVSDGIAHESIALDPGIGFGKTTDHNLELIRRLGEFVTLGCPVLVGASRKAFLGRLLDIEDPVERDRATAILTALAVERGASIVRVHDVAGSREAVDLTRAIVGGGGLD